MSSSFLPIAPFWGSGSRNSMNPLNSPADVGPLFRFLDDTTRAFDNLPAFLSNGDGQQRVWQPRFDVRELENGYELRGEMPGVEVKDLDVQMTDSSTLLIRGKTESERSEGHLPRTLTGEGATINAADGPASASANETAHEDDKSDAGSFHSDSSYVQPTVEDDAPETTSTLTGVSTTPAESTMATASEPAPQSSRPEQPAQAAKSTYWLSERRTGSFQRTFTFSQRIDQDSVVASLRNGVLSVNVPKAAVSHPRRVNVE